MWKLLKSITMAEIKIMNRKKFLFVIVKLLVFSVILSVVSCGRKPNIRKGLNHEFLFGTDKDLYRTKDLQWLVSSSIATKKLNEEYEDIIKSKKALYSPSVQFNVSNLNELLKIRTVTKGEKVKISSSDNIYIDPNISFLNEYQILDYTIQRARTEKQKILKKLLGKINNFKGIPDTDYYIFSKFLGNYLILYKLGAPESIPYDELPLARRVGNWLAVPLVGYPAKYCKAVRVKGYNNIKETSIHRPLCKGLSPNTEYVRLSNISLNKQVFEYKQKLDFFPRDFFEGQWLYAKIRLRSSMNNLRAVVKSARLVKFHPALRKLDVLEDNNLKQDDEIRTLFIPVEYRDYEINKDSERLDSSFSERYKDVDESQSPYLQVLFNEAFGADKRGISIKSAVITQDYISFDVEKTEKGMIVDQDKYVFKRYKKNENYREKKWFHTDNNLFFPLYSVERRYYEDLTDHTRDDLNRFKRAVRFDTHLATQTEKASKIKEIRWHFSTQTNKEEPWIREMGLLAIDLVNQALAKAGEGSGYTIKLLLDDTNDQELGDMRNNILNITRSEGDSKKAYYKGFNIVNPFTGEMIAATTNVWITPIINEYIQLMRQYIRFHVYSANWNMQIFSPDTKARIIEELSLKEEDNEDQTQGDPIQNLQCAFSKEYFNNKEEGEVFKIPLGVTPFFHEKIQKLCKEDVVKFIEDFIEKNAGKKPFRLTNPPLEDHNVLSTCAERMAKEHILQETVKHILHSLGLDDMHSSSVDSENFYNKKEVSALIGRSSADHYFSLTQKLLSHPDLPKYSSVMENMDKQYPILSIPGKLDIAALRFLYFDRLDLKDGTTLEIPSGANSDRENPQKSILQTALDRGYTQEKLQDKQKHKMCDSMANVYHLLCGEEDYGSTVTEIASNAVCKIHNSFLMSRQRYDAEKIEKVEISSVKQQDILERMYQKWQNYIKEVLKGKGESFEDYTFLDPNDIEKYLEILKDIDQEMKPYKIIREIIFDYFKRLSFVPTKHCIYYHPDKGYKAIALENIEENMLSKYPDTPENRGKEFMNCWSDIAIEGAKEWAKREGLGNIQLVRELGFLGKARRYLIRSNLKTDPLDEVQNFKAIFDNFVNTFRNKGIFREPDLANQYYKQWLDYATKGLSLDPYIDIYLSDGSKLSDFRVLSYKIDTIMEDMIDTYPAKNLWQFRFMGLKWLEDNFKERGKALFSQHFHYQTFVETELTNLLNSFKKYPGLYSDFPILNQIYKKYEKENNVSEVSFYDYFRRYPAILHVREEQQNYYRLPFADSENHILSQLYRQYNKFSQCIDEEPDCVSEEEKENNPCCDEIPLEEKRAFIDLILDTDNDF